MAHSKSIIITLFIVIMTALGGCRRHNTDGTISIVPSQDSIEILRAAGMNALNKSLFDSAVSCGKHLLEIAAASADRNMAEQASIYGNILIGQGYLFSDSTNPGYSYLHEAELLCLRTHNDSALASVYNGLGIHASNIEKDFPEALRYFFLGLDAAKRSSNERLHSLLLVNIALIYTLNDDPSSLRYAIECYNHGKQREDNFLRYAGALSAAYALRFSDIPRALDYIREAEMILHSESIHDGSNLYYIYGYLLRRNGDTEDAAECLRHSIELEKAHHYGDIRAFVEYSEMQLSLGRRSTAVALLDTALQITVDYKHSRIFRPEVLNALATTHNTLGNSSLADRYRKMADDEKNATQNAERETAIQQIKIKYDLERADNEVNRQRIQLLEKQRTVNLLLTLAGIALTLAGSLIYLYQRKSRLYAAIVTRTTQSAREEAYLRDTISQLEASVAALSETAVVIPHDRKDPEANPRTSAASSESLSRLKAKFESLLLNPEVFTDSSISKDKIASLLGTNRTYISKIVNEIYGMTFPQFINSLRIKEAVRRLSDPRCDTPLKALSAQLGYSSMTTFYAKFSEATGMTPAAFREKSRNISHNPVSYTDKENA